MADKRIAFLLFLLSAGLVSVEPCQGGSFGFESTGSLPAARRGITTTLLPNGKVLLVGREGDSGSSYSNRAELYDPANGTWSPTGNPATTGSNESIGSGHTATLLPNGKVLAAGGTGTFIFTSNGAELYDPATGTWTQTQPFFGRYSHTATLLPNGKVLVAGGAYNNRSVIFNRDLTTTSAQLYDPASATWTNTGSMTAERAGHTATLLPNGKVLIAGGYWLDLQGSHSLASTELYDPATGVWTETGSFSSERVGHTATLLPSGKVLVAGGSTAELYDAATGTWAATGSLATARSSHTATLLPNGKVVVTGGRTTGGSYVASAELYDEASGTWKSTGSLVTARSSHTATLLPNGYLLIAGGGTDTTALASAELYGPKPTLLNISTRVNVQAGDNAMIGGFIIGGAEPKTVIVRGIGPSLGVPGALADPIIEVHGPSGELLATNDNWREATTRQEIADSGLAPANDLEPALWGVINPGAYTVIVRGKNDATGIGLFEAYDLGEAADSNLANVSTRGLVQTGDNILIGGFIVGGGTQGWTAKVLVRAIGPSVPVSGALGDPTLELRDASGTLLASNDNWKAHSDGSSQQAEIEATGLQPANDLESALLQTFPAGNYTAIVRGVNNTTGIGLVEAYNLP
ncbi:MAG: kelch repeat-containing protein [Chthoniobacterales bacterium]